MATLDWSPSFTLTSAIVRGLMQIEAARALVDHTPLPPAAEAELHALVEVGPRAKPTPYRKGQNAINNSTTGALIYLPPEA